MRTTLSLWLALFTLTLSILLSQTCVAQKNSGQEDGSVLVVDETSPVLVGGEKDEPSPSKVWESFVNAWRNYGIIGVLSCIVIAAVMILVPITICLVLVGMVMGLLGLDRSNEGCILAPLLGALFLKKR